MSLSGVPVGRFPPIAFSPACSLSRPSASSTPLAGTRSLPCVSARWSGMSGCLANPTPGTGYEPNIRVDAYDEHTPINLPDSNGKNSWRIMSRLTVVIASGKLVRIWKEKRFFSTLFRSESKGKRDRDQNVVQSLEDREHLHKILERKVDLAVRGERIAQQRLYEAEAEVEARYWEKRNSDIAFHEINQEFESHRFQLQQASRWADQAQRD